MTALAAGLTVLFEAAIQIARVQHRRAAWAMGELDLDTPSDIDPPAPSRPQRR